MRKLILSMALAIVSVGAYAQGTPNCTPTANKPEIGATYTYQVVISGQSNSVQFGVNNQKKYHWFITKDALNLLEGDKIGADDIYFSVENATTDYNVATAKNDNLKIKWKPDALESNTPFYLVVKYVEPINGCETTNVKAMEIKPLNRFKLMVTPVKDGAGQNFGVAEQKIVCSPNIVSAKIENGKLKHTYEKTILYYKVEMSGFSGNWKPTIKLPALEGVAGHTNQRKYESVKWNQGDGTNFVDFVANFEQNGNEKLLKLDNATDKNTFILQVVIDNGSYEGLQDENIVLSAKGNMILAGGGEGRRDVDDDCNEYQNDTPNRNGELTILARPTITAGVGELIEQFK